VETQGFAWKPVGLVAGASMALLLIVANRYGWHRDELYFLEAGKHLAWGYVDQPPFAPFVARVADAVAPDNLVVLRCLPALATAATIVFGALLAREMGGTRGAQVAAAGVVAGGGFVLGVGHLLSTAVFDLTAWMALLWLAARLLRTSDGRLWIAYGAVAGMSLLNKDLVVLLTASLAAGIIAARRWDVLRTRWLVVGVAAAAVIASPQLVWQARHDWPQFEMARVLSDRLGVENRVLLLPSQVLLVGVLLVFLLWRGVRWLRLDPAASRFQALLLAWPIGLVATLVTAGRPYYMLPLTVVVLIAGVVATAARGSLSRLRWWIVANAVLTIPVSLPLLPVSTLASSHVSDLNEGAAETVGWPELADQVASVVHGLPPDERAGVVVLAGSYGEAGAIDRFGPARNLPHAFSPHNHYWFFRRPTDDDATVVAVRWPVSSLRQWFASCEQVATIDNGLDVDNEVQGEPIAVCRGLRGHWTEVWPEMKFLS